MLSKEYKLAERLKHVEEKFCLKLAAAHLPSGITQKHAQQKVVPGFCSAIPNIIKIVQFAREFYCCRFAQYGVRSLCGSYRSLVPRLCVLFSPELFCVPVVKVEDQTDCWTFEAGVGRRTRGFPRCREHKAVANSEFLQGYKCSYNNR